MRERRKVLDYLKQGVKVTGTVVALTMGAATVVGAEEVTQQAIEKVEFTDEQMNTLTDLSDVIDGTADGFYFAEIGEEYSEEDKARFIMEQLQYVTDYKFPIEMPEYKKEVAFHVFGGLQQLFGAGKIVVHMPDVTTMSDQTVSAEDKKLLGWIEFESYLYDLKFKTPDEVLDAHSVEIIGGVEFATKEWGELAELVNLINKEAEKIN